MALNIKDLLDFMVGVDASDLHLKVGSPPGFRVHGRLRPHVNGQALSPEDVKLLLSQIFSHEQQGVYEDKLELDFSVGLPGLGRFRVNAFHQRGTSAAVLRRIPEQIPHIDTLGFPPVVRELCSLPRGLVLVTGPTGSGKSTTLASMIDFINRTECAHILTLEDPIEFVHADKKCFVNQREIGSDSRSFNVALRSALREDPDVILVGEMRDLETIGLAIKAAETGHLVFATLHTTSAVQSIDRIIDVFPHSAQQQVRTQLASTLQAVISQVLLPRVAGGRVCIQEIMVGTDGVRNLIREGKTPQLLNMIQTGGARGMQTLESQLEKLVKAGDISAETAIAKANNPSSLGLALGRGVTQKIKPSKPSRLSKTRDSAPARKKPSSQQLAQRLAQATGAERAAREAATAEQPLSKAAPTPPTVTVEKAAPTPPTVTVEKVGVVDDFEKFRREREGV